MKSTRSAAVVRNGSSKTTAVAARRGGEALICGVSLTVLAVVTAAGGGAPMAHAQTITLSGSQTTTQSVNGATVEVQTAPGFSVDTTTGPAISLNGNDGTSFADENTSTITGQTDGIYIRNTENGALSLTTTGTVTGRANFGIRAQNLTGEGSPTSLTLSTAAVSGFSGGIYARNRGTEALSITSTGMVSASNGNGILARNDLGTDLTIIATAVAGSYNGISANNYGSGSLSVTATGTVSGTYGAGIAAISNYENLTITAATVTGGTGIAARNRGSGVLSITSTGTVTGTAQNGIYAASFGNRRVVVGDAAPTSTPPADLTISTVAVSGASNGILAANFNAGALSITSTGDVTGTRERGIYAINGNRYYYSKAMVNVDTFEVNLDAPAYSRPRPTNLTISATSVTGGRDGIYAINNGTGALSITTTGTVTGTSRRGIFASNGGNDPSREIGGRAAAEAALGGESAFYAGTDLTISTAAVSGGTDGIFASNFGTGALKITSTGTVTGSDGVGISASNGGLQNGYYYYYGGDRRLAQSGESSGVFANAGTDLTVIATSAFGTQHGILATNYGTGALSITSTGEVITTGGRGSRWHLCL